MANLQRNQAQPGQSRELRKLTHDFRNALGPIMVSLEVLEGHPEPAAVERLHQIIHRQTLQLEGLVGNLARLRDELEGNRTPAALPPHATGQ